MPTRAALGAGRRRAAHEPGDRVTPTIRPDHSGPEGEEAQGAQARSRPSSTWPPTTRPLTAEQRYDPTPIINELRSYVDTWRKLPNPEQWHVTPETARLLQHWRHHQFQGVRPFFCQIEAVETAIWLTEVAPKLGAARQEVPGAPGRRQRDANPELFRMALKLATGAGKTTVMAMLIAWQTVNAVRHPASKQFTRGFLIVAPGITIKDRLRVLLPQDPDNYYASREIVPADMLAEINAPRSSSPTTTPSSCARRSTSLPGGRALLQAEAQPLQTMETEGEMLQRVMPNCWASRTWSSSTTRRIIATATSRRSRGRLEDQGDDKDEATKNDEAARLWITGIEALKRKLGVRAVFDLSATPFFLRGSGYDEGTLFPWVVSDFSLMDAIECGIVKLPRVPVSDNSGADTPIFRNLWDHIGKSMPKRACASPASWTRAPCRRAGNRAAGAVQPLRSPSPVGGAKVSTCRRCSSSCATTPPPPTSSTTGSRVSSARTRASGTLRERPPRSCSATTTTTACRSPG